MKDITDTQDVRGTEMIGRRYVFVSEMSLTRDTSVGWDSIRPTSKVRKSGTPVYVPVGTVPVGTPVRVTKVVEYSFGPFAKAPSRMFATFGEIESGSFAGQIAALDKAGIQAYPPGVNEELVQPAP